MGHTYHPWGTVPCASLYVMFTMHSVQDFGQCKGCLIQSLLRTCISCILHVLQHICIDATVLNLFRCHEHAFLDAQRLLECRKTHRIHQELTCADY